VIGLTALDDCEAGRAVSRRPDRRFRRAEDADGFYLPKDGIVGIMVVALSSPSGAVFARATESFRGHGARPAHEAERELVLGEVSRNLEPGVTIVIAEITDPDPGVSRRRSGARRKRHPTSRARRVGRAPRAMSGATAGRR
jgi:hypothetical protein